MIWIRRLPRGDDEDRTERLKRALTLLLLQTSVFGIASAILMTVITSFYPDADWVRPLVIASLFGLGGGFLGAVIVFSMLSISTYNEE